MNAKITPGVRPPGDPATNGHYVIDPLDVRTRLTEFKLLRAGWLDGVGVAPSPEGLDWLAAAFEQHWLSDLPRPHLYPTAEGGVRAEWSLLPHELSLDIGLSARTGVWHALNLDDDSDESRTLNLNQASVWDWLAGEVRRRMRAAA
jgi:hypothetical protein